MSIPELPSVMLSLLKLAADQHEHAIRDAIDSLAKQFQLSEQEREELLPMGNKYRFRKQSLLGFNTPKTCLAP